MRVGIVRAVIVCLCLAVLWGLPIPSEYVGGVGNYDVMTWGLYGWIKFYTLQGSFGVVPLGPVEHHYPLGLILTIIGTVLVAGVGIGWVVSRRSEERRQRLLGLLVCLIPAILWVVEVWWPDVYSMGGGAEGYRYGRGSFGYLVEHRNQFTPPNFPPETAPITGQLTLDLMRVAWSLLLSAAALALAVRIGFWVGRVGIPKDRPAG